MGCAALIGLALTATGAGLGAAGAEESGDAMNSATQEAINAENNFSGKAMPVFNQALQQSTPQAAAKDIATGQQQFKGAANQLQQAQPGFASFQNPKNTAVSNARAGLANQAMGNFAGYSNLPQQWSLQNQQAWPQLGVLNQEAANRLSIYPALMQMASRKGQGLQAYGSLLGGLGSLSGAFGGLGGSSASNTNPATTYGAYSGSWDSPAQNWSTGYFGQ